VKSKHYSILILCCVVLAATGFLAAMVDNPPAAGQNAPDLSGTWTGTLEQKSPEGPTAAMSINIAADANGGLLGTATLDSKCVKNPRLKVRVEGNNVKFVGSDAQGDSLSLRGTLDQTGKILTMTFSANGSASGRCESVKGTATLQKQ
jgi:hypothetical protein